MLYKVVLVSDVPYCDSVITCIYVHSLLDSFLIYRRILSSVPCVIQ